MRRLALRGSANDCASALRRLRRDISGQELEICQTAILLTEEALLEALCFDFVVDSPHAELVDLFEARPVDPMLEEAAWSVANDSSVFPR